MITGYDFNPADELHIEIDGAWKFDEELELCFIKEADK